MTSSPDRRVIASPEKSFRLELEAIEAMNSQWVEHGTVIRTADSAVLAEIGEWRWHVDRADWLAEDRLKLALRRFPGDAPGLWLTLDLGAGAAEAEGDPDRIPLGQLSDWLEAWYARHRKG